MPTYLSPGVYMEEVSSGSKPIEGVGTAVAAFVGFAERGPANQPTLVTNWTQFTQTFGDFVDGSYLAHSVYGYFLNGGGAAYVVRIGGDDSDAEFFQRRKDVGVPPAASKMRGVPRHHPGGEQRVAEVAGDVAREARGERPRQHDRQDEVENGGNERRGAGPFHADRPRL